MKASWNIFWNDLKNIGTNWVALVLIGGLTFLPSLYAWFNIEASWDPYGNTDQIPVGIVNEDIGSVVRGEEVHVGDELVETLKDNRSMNWQFVDREEAMDKLEYGDYFAVLVIPETFSERLGSVVSGEPQKADVEYYVNEKINAIAPKITEKGASVIVDEVSSNFISTVNGIIFEIFNDLGIELEENLPDIERFEEYIFTLEENLPAIHEQLIETMDDADQAHEWIEQAQGLVPRVDDATSSGLETIDETTDFLNKAEERLNEMEPIIEDELTAIQQMVSDTNAYVQKMDNAEIDLMKDNPFGEQLPTQIDAMLASIETMEEVLQQLQQVSDGNEEGSVDQERIEEAINELTALEENLRDLQEEIDQAQTFITDKQGEIDDVLAEIQERTEIASDRVEDFVVYYQETIEPTVREEVARTKDTLEDAREILLEIQSTVPEIVSMLTRTKDRLGEGQGILVDVDNEFPYVQDKVNELAERTRSIQEDTDMNELIQLLQNDPDAERGFFAEPVVLNENKLFPIPNYGTGMTPFYTVLSIWVGGLLLISLLSTDIHHHENYTGRQMYFGRLATFMGIGFLQTLIVTVGNIVVLQVDIQHPIWFIVFGLFCSAVFISIVYTLVSVFGDVGKALAIILLVLQIAGSGGTYPIVLLPEFFQSIHPFLPFTYAIDLMREAVGGIVWTRAVHDLLFLLLFSGIALIVGGFLKEIINKQTNKLKSKSKESGLFH